MKAFSLFVAIIFLAGAAQLKAAQPDAGLAVQDVSGIWRGARMVKDLAAFDIAKLSSQETGAWIVARIFPGGMSGTAHNQGAYIQAETGKVIDSGIRPKVVILVGGQWKLIELLSGRAPREGTYRWKEPSHNYFDRHFSMLDLFSVFTGPKNKGTVICQFYTNKSGAQQFSSVTLIPDQWKTLVKPAHEYYIQHASDFTGNDSSKLHKLALNDNPFIGMTAIRQLSGKTTADEEVDALVDLAGSLPKYRQAVFIVKLLNRNDDNSCTVISNTIGRAKKSADLTGIALGMYTWSISRGRPIVYYGSKRKLFDQLTKSWKTFDPTATDDWTKTLNKALLSPKTKKDKPTETKK